MSPEPQEKSFCYGYLNFFGKVAGIVFINAPISVSNCSNFPQSRNYILMYEHPKLCQALNNQSIDYKTL